MTISLGISTCPNDTFIFDAWVNGRLPDAPPVACRLADIATLNETAFQGGLDVVKVSFYAYARLQQTYRLLDAGGALGRGCGPLIVARPQAFDCTRLTDPDVTVAVPGRWTTAHLLLSLYEPGVQHTAFMRFDQIMPAVAGGAVQAGVIIHEGRFTYQNYGLVMLADLGQWWEQESGYPLPLGGIIARRSLGEQRLLAVESAIRQSLEYARSNPDAPLAFMKAHAREMDPEVMRRHVDLYVNRYTYSYGTDGREAIEHLLAQAGRAIL